MKPAELSWNDLPANARRKVRALLSAESEKHPQGHYGGAVRAALARLPEMPRGKLPPRRTPAGRELSAMLRVPATREQAFTRIVNAVRLKRSILKGAAHLGVHKWTLFQYMKQHPALAKRVRDANEKSRADRRKATTTRPAPARRGQRRSRRRQAGEDR
jgi:hypothetical protein